MRVYEVNTRVPSGMEAITFRREFRHPLPPVILILRRLKEAGAGNRILSS